MSIQNWSPQTADMAGNQVPTRVAETLDTGRLAVTDPQDSDLRITFRLADILKLSVRCWGRLSNFRTADRPSDIGLNNQAGGAAPVLLPSRLSIPGCAPARTRYRERVRRLRAMRRWKARFDKDPEQ